MVAQVSDNSNYPIWCSNECKEDWLEQSSSNNPKWCKCEYCGNEMMITITQIEDGDDAVCDTCKDILDSE